MSATVYEYRAIDPMAMILHGEMLRIWYLIHHPHVEFDKSIEELLTKATPEERREIAARVKVMQEYATAVQKVMAKRESAQSA